MTRPRRHSSDGSVPTQRPSGRPFLVAAAVMFAALLSAAPFSSASAEDPPIEPTTVVVTVPITLPPSTEPSDTTAPPATTPPTEAPTTEPPTTEPGSTPVTPRPRVTTRARTTAAPARSTTTTTAVEPEAAPEGTEVPSTEAPPVETTTAPRGTAPLAAAAAPPRAPTTALERPPTQPASDRAALPPIVPLAFVGIVLVAGLGVMLRRRSSGVVPQAMLPRFTEPQSPAAFAPRTGDDRAFALFADAAPPASMSPVSATTGSAALASLFPPRPQAVPVDNASGHTPARLDWGAETNDSPRRHR